MRSLAGPAGLSLSQYVESVQRVIANLAPDARSDHTNETSSWLGAVRDQVLTALLVHGYPVLGLTLLLCAIGMPLPDGIVTTVAGSLIAQGRMDWVWAGTLTVAASMLGDGISFGLGRLLSREVLERHGRWFGYTPARGIRVQSLFDRWGLLTVFMSRTFMSYLAPVASLLAGMSQYRLVKFLAIALVGRLIWAASYLSFGYEIGGDWEAATGFLENLGALLVSLAVLTGSGLAVATRRTSGGKIELT